MYKQNCYKIL